MFQRKHNERYLLVFDFDGFTKQVHKLSLELEIQIPTLRSDVEE